MLACLFSYADSDGLCIYMVWGHEAKMQNQGKLLPGNSFRKYLDRDHFHDYGLQHGHVEARSLRPASI